MTTTGPNSPGTLADDSSVGTAQAWNTPANAASSNNSYTTAGVNGGIGTQETHYLKATNFGFAIADTQIDGILVEIERKCSHNSASDYVTDTKVQLVIGGTISGSNLADTGTKWPTSDAYASYGGATSLWGLTPSVSDINASNFGVVLTGTIRDTQGKAAITAYVDHIRITVYSSAGGGGSSVKTLAAMGVG